VIGGYRSTGSGLLVPEEHSRKREVWTRDEGRLLDRATKLLTSRQVKFQMACARDCGEPMTQQFKQPGGLPVLECGCTTREFAR
jgi:hypothetical protein